MGQKKACQGHIYPQPLAGNRRDPARTTDGQYVVWNSMLNDTVKDMRRSTVSTHTEESVLAQFPALAHDTQVLDTDFGNLDIDDNVREKLLIAFDDEKPYSGPGGEPDDGLDHVLGDEVSELSTMTTDQLIARANDLGLDLGDGDRSKSELEGLLTSQILGNVLFQGQQGGSAIVNHKDVRYVAGKMNGQVLGSVDSVMLMESKRDHWRGTYEDGGAELFNYKSQELNRVVNGGTSPLYGTSSVACPFDSK